MRQNACAALQTAAQIAADHLRRTNNPAVGWGDTHLLHEIASKLGLPPEGFATEKKVLDRIERSHQGVLMKRYTSLPTRGLGRVRQFWLPEFFPKSKLQEETIIKGK